MKITGHTRSIVAFAALFLQLACFQTAFGADHVDNMLVVTIDGLRWKEVFGGVDATMLAAKSRAVPNPTLLRTQYLRSSKDAQRERLMPFLWSVVAKQGEVFGDREQQSVSTTANKIHISYPGYSELFTGIVEPTIKDNSDLLNPNKTVFEWLNEKPAFAGNVAAFGAWDRLFAIINPARSGVFVMAGWRPIPKVKDAEPSSVQTVMGELLKHTIRVNSEAPPDSFCETVALDYLRQYHPRVMYVMLDEADHWAHANDYELYLDAAGRSDDFIRRLWQLAQSMPQYTGKTGLLITCDHGRGSGSEWTSHGPKIKGSEGTWAAVMSPVTPAEGVRKDVTTTQSQVAATIAQLLGEDFTAAMPNAAKPLPGAVNLATTAAAH